MDYCNDIVRFLKNHPYIGVCGVWYENLIENVKNLLGTSHKLENNIINTLFSNFVFKMCVLW